MRTFATWRLQVPEWDGSHRRHGPPHLVAVSATGGIGGPTKSLLGLLEQYRGAVRCTLIAPEGHLADTVRREGLAAEVITIPRWRRAHHVARILATLRITGWLLRHRRRVDVIHANGEAEVNLVGPGTVLCGLDLVVSARASQTRPWVRRTAPLWRRLLPRARWVAVSTVPRDLVISAGLAEPLRVEVIPNPIDTRQVRATERLESERTRIGYLGGKGFDKGFDLLPDIIRALGRRDVRWQLFTSPPSPEAPRLQHEVWARLAELQDDGFDIVHHGKLGDVRGAYAACDIVLAPSRRESFGRIPVEAMANGLPVVASAIPTFAEFFDGTEAGRLFPVGDVVAAATELGALVEDPTLREQMGEAGHRRARDFAPGPLAERFLKIYGFQDHGSPREGEG